MKIREYSSCDSKDFISAQILTSLNRLFLNLTSRFGQTTLVFFFMMTSINAIADEMMPDNAPHPSNAWDGFYVGGQLGAAWNTSHWKYKNPNYFNTLGPILLGSNFHFKGTDVIGGGNVGFNYQTGFWVLGLEGSVLDSNIEHQERSPFFPITDQYSTTMHWFTTAKGRAGYAFDQWLPYIDAGWARSNVSLTLNDTGAGIRASSKQWVNGWVAGAGVDYRLTEHCSLGVAYDYIQLNLNNKTIHCPRCGTGVGLGAPKVEGHIKTQTVTARLNYLFG